MRRRIHQIVEPHDDGDAASAAFDIFILGLIFLNVVALVFQTEEAFYNWSPLFFDLFETVSVVVFSAEYMLRIWSCVENPEYAKPISGRLRFAMTPMAVIDLLAIAPFYLSFLGVDLRFVRAFRLFRLFRIAKIGRYLPAMRLMGRAVRKRTEELVVSVVLIFILLIVASSLVYYAENEAQPEAFASIPRAMWWGVATLTTVGYGDVYPITLMGRMMGAVIAVLGIGLFALPTGIISSGFLDEIQEERRRKQLTGDVCHTCGQALEVHEPEAHEPTE